MRTRYRSIVLLRVRVACCLLLLLVGASSASSSSSHPSLSSSSPYELLGVSRSSSQIEIQKAYRQLCLKYHPDKNGNRPKKEQQRCEANFKAVQHAYSLIGDDAARRTHDTRQAFGSTSSASSRSSPYGTDPIAQAFFRAYATAANGPTSSFFTRRSGGAYRRPFPTSASSAEKGMPADLNLNVKSIYIQKVQVPLEELYRGTDWEFTLQDNLWTRWRAAIRGKSVYLSLYQGLMYSLPLLRTSRYLALVAGLVIMNATLPKPSPHQTYKTHLRRGSKGGGKTRVKFASTTQTANQWSQPEIIFQVEEAPHKRYKRVDNDLHTTLRITPQEAKKGCTKHIPSLAEDHHDDDDDDNNHNHHHHTNKEEAISVKIPPNVSNGDTVRVRGQGWPVRNAPDVYLHGDMIVQVQIRATKQRKRSRSRTQRFSFAGHSASKRKKKD
jgi:DnaJ-class molecular chaperone